MKTIMKGVFQGSILGSILFNIFMNDLSYAIDECTLFTYADDAQQFKSAENIDQVEHAINADLKKVDVWYEFNQRRQIIQNINQITFGGVERNPVLTYEGTVIPVQTNWNSLASLPIVSLNLRVRCVKSVVKSVSKQVAVLNRLKKILPFELRTDIYRAFITPHFNYCSEPWHHCGKRGSGKPKKINERALRFVTRDKSTMYETLLKQLNLMSPLNQIIVKMATGVYKAIHG